MTLLKRLLLGWRVNVPFRGRRLAVPVVLSALLLCCCCPLGYLFADVSVRQAGLLPTYTPRPTAPTSTAAPSNTPVPSRSPRPSATPRIRTAAPTVAQRSAPVVTAAPTATVPIEPTWTPSPESTTPTAAFTVAPEPTTTPIPPRFVARPTALPASPSPIEPLPTAAPAAAPATSGRSTGASNPNAFTCIGGCTEPPPGSQCVIKGNVNSKGERIYHLPSMRDYNRTNIRPEEGDRWFCTEGEARAAGFRPAQR